MSNSPFDVIKNILQKSMKLTLNLSFFLFTFALFGNKALSLTDYKIKIICREEKNKSTCIKDLQKKRTNLNKGNAIQIPVIPYKKR